MVEEMEEEEAEEEGLKYATDTPLGGSYMTPPSTGGRSSPSPAPSCSPTPGDSDPENNMALCTEELEAHIEAFLEEAEEDLEMYSSSREYLSTSGSGSYVPRHNSFHRKYRATLRSTEKSPQEGLSSLQRSCRTMSL